VGTSDKKTFLSKRKLYQRNIILYAPYKNGKIESFLIYKKRLESSIFFIFQG